MFALKTSPAFPESYFDLFYVVKASCDVTVLLDLMPIPLTAIETMSPRSPVAMHLQILIQEVPLLASVEPQSKPGSLFDM